MVEEKGVVNEDQEAILLILLDNGATIECVIDTGFNGSLLLPRDFVEANSMVFAGREEVLMVEENSIEIDTAIAEIKWLAEKFSVRILVSETNEALIGTQMLTNSILEIDYQNLTVKITK